MNDIILPKEWISTELGSVMDLKYGKPLPENARDNGVYPVFGSNGIVGGHSQPLVNGAGIIIGRKGSYGEVQLSDSPFFPIDTTYYIDEFFGQPLKYWYYQLRNLPLTELNRSTSIPGLSRNDAYRQVVQLPPVAEQKVIAERLDVLLAWVKTTKASLERIPDTLKYFRQSVLSAAANGNLLDEESNNVEGNRSFMRLGDAEVEIKTGPFGSALHKSDYQKNGIPVINPMHISEGKIYPSESMCISEDKYNKLEAWHLHVGDVILGRRGEMGRAATIREPVKMLCGTGSMILRVSKKILPEYLEIVLRSPSAISYFNTVSVGSTMVNLNQKMIREFEFYFPTIDKQSKIISLVDKYFAFAEIIEEKVKTALKRVDDMAQSILARAFCGELTADWRSANPDLIRDENSSKTLLEKIKSERRTLKELPKPKFTTVKKKKGGSMSKKIISVDTALKEAGKPLSGQELLAAAGYPSDSSTEELERFFLNIRESLTRDKSIVKLERSDDGQDWFVLASTASQTKDC